MRRFVDSFFRTIRVFAAEGELGRQLSELEGNVEEALRLLDSRKVAGWRVTEIQSSVYPARTGELVRVDAAAAAQTVLLPVATQESAGFAVGVVRVTGSNNIEVRPLEGSIGGAASHTISDALVHVYVSTGVDWRRVA